MSLRAFGGAPLEGHKLVRLVYVDEAGISNPAHEPVVVVCGVIVNGDRALTDLKSHLQSIVSEFIPEEFRKGFVLEAKHLFNGGGPLFDRKNPRVSEERRIELAIALADTPRKFGLPIAAAWLERADERINPSNFHALRPRDRTLIDHGATFTMCLMLVERWMRDNANEENCVIVVEDNTQARELLKRAQQNQQRNEVPSVKGENMSQFLPLTRVHEDPLFQEKRPSSPLEVADFCAYVFKRWISNQNDAFWSCFVERISPQWMTFVPKGE